jgi:hypothetical protein
VLHNHVLDLLCELISGFLLTLLKRLFEIGTILIDRMQLLLNLLNAEVFVFHNMPPDWLLSFFLAARQYPTSANPLLM